MIFLLRFINLKIFLRSIIILMFKRWTLHRLRIIMKYGSNQSRLIFSNQIFILDWDNFSNKSSLCGIRRFILNTLLNWFLPFLLIWLNILTRLSNLFFILIDYLLTYFFGLIVYITLCYLLILMLDLWFVYL